MLPLTSISGLFPRAFVPPPPTPVAKGPIDTVMLGHTAALEPPVRSSLAAPSQSRPLPRPVGVAPARVGMTLTPSPVLAAVPQTPAEVVQTNYYGTIVSDPYRWLENSADLAVTDWVTAQNAATQSYLNTLPGRNEVTQRLQQVLNVGSLGAPAPVGDALLYFRRNGLQNQPVLYRQNADGSEQTLIDPNTWSTDGTEALDWDFPSKDGRYIAYGRSSNGTEMSTLHLLDTQTMTLLPDQIPNTRGASLTWLPDSSGFYYTRYPQPGTVPPGQENYHRKIYFHALGADPNKDALIYGDGLNPTDWPDMNLSDDGRYLLITVQRGETRNDAYVLDRQSNQMTTLYEGQNVQSFGEIVDGFAYMVTNDGAPRNRLVKIDLAHPQPQNWKEIVPQQDGTLQTFDIVGGKLVTSSLVNATSRLSRYDLDGKKEADLALPGLGTVDTIAGDPGKPDLYFRFSSFNVPPTVVHYNTQTGQSDVWRQLQIPGFNPGDYEVHQEWFNSKDGTRVPMFVVNKKGLVLDGSHPTYLTGYGGFDISMTPAFNSTMIPWLENGGVFVEPSLRGGGEFGAAWHEGGMLGNKQHVFDDFEGAGQWLVDNRYTSPSHLGISGGSNGGLLMGAAVTQRPDLFGVVVSHVPLLDMIRYDHFGIAKLWDSEYGSASDPQQFQWLAAYSPYHNVKDGTPYPATLFMSGADDSRVNPLHARKMAARMQAATSSDQPVLLLEESNAGHGQGKPLTKAIEDAMDELTFMAAHTGLTFRPPAVAGDGNRHNLSGSGVAGI